MSTIHVSLPSLLLGGVIATGSFLLMSQMTPVPYGSWGPPKNGIVNLFEEPSTAIAISANGSLMVFQVPNDRWLTVTAVLASGPSSALVWGEMLGGTFTAKGKALDYYTPTSGALDLHSLAITPEAAGGTVGWVFRPGSQVVIRNVVPAEQTLSRYSLIGYQTRD